MRGMGFIENNKALCMLSVLTNTHMLMAARDSGVEKLKRSYKLDAPKGVNGRNSDNTKILTIP
jgi:hypothetical protein